jgi:hypothetical protein
MKMNYLYLVDNIAFYKSYKNNNIFKIKLSKKEIKLGKISDINLFYDTFNTFLIQKHLINILYNEKITLIINETYTNSDKYLLEEILNKINFNQVYFINVSNILDLKKYNYLEINNDYLLMYYKNNLKKKKYRLIPSNFFNSNEELFNYINNNFPSKDTLLYGNNTSIEDILKELDKFNNKINYYILEKPSSYLVNQMFNLKTS